MSLRDLSSPAEIELLNDLDGAVTPSKCSPRHDGAPQKVHMKKQLGLLEGCAIILGIILGSGEIFQ